eukprot:Skav227543  [mRNA]  locus=scaffold2241:169914:174596:- [translate_table: standard]
MAYLPGALIFVDYGEVPQLLHSRLVLAHVHNDDYIIATPDLDVYSETLNAGNPDYVGFYPALPGGAPPAGIAGIRVYNFGAITAADYAALMEAGRQEAVNERARLGVAAGVMAAAGLVGAPGALGGAAVQEVWILAEFVEGHKIGEIVNPPAGHAVDGKWGLMHVTDSNGKDRPCLIHQIMEDQLGAFCDERVKLCRAAEAAHGNELLASDDVRTLEVRYGMNGERHRLFKDTVNELQEVAFPDYPFEPRTTHAYMKAIASISESATAQHHMWVSSSKIPDGDRSIHEDEVLARILDAAVCYDALNVANLACMELVCRRRQLLAEAHSLNPASPSYLGAEHFLGQTYKAGGGIVTPMLAEHVAKRLQQQSQIWKEKRKAEENKKAKPKGGRGRGFLRGVVVNFFCRMAFHSSADERERDVFPLPYLRVDGGLQSAVCRTVQRRILRRHAVDRGVNKAIESLNLLYCGGENFKRSTVEDWSSLRLCQREVLSHLIAVVKDAGPPPAGACGPEALRALRVASNTYTSVEAGVGIPVSMRLDQLSLPDGKVAGVDLLEALPKPVMGLVADFESKMLVDADVWTETSRDVAGLKPYSDPLLKRRDSYLGFLRRLQQAGVLGYTSQCRSRVGAFAVSKKAKWVEGVKQERQRLVLDCRLTNALFRPSPHTELGSLQAMSELEIGDLPLYVAGADIKDCFYAVSMPSYLWDFFGLELDISLAEARSIWGDEINTQGTITPCITVLPMGFSWSFYLVQQIHEASALQSLGCDRSRVVLDGYPSLALKPGELLTMPYCDNVHCMGDHPDAVDEGWQYICSGLEQLGFSLHEEQNAGAVMETLGGVIDGERGQVRTTSKRMWYLIEAFEYIQHIVVSIDDVQRLLGHAMVVCTLNRNGMSIFRRLYDFVSSGSRPRRLTAAESMECKIFSGLVPFLFADLRRPWSEDVHVTDASPDGFGICHRQVDSETVQAVGRWNERLRFKRLPPEEWQPRRRAAGVDPFVDVSSVLNVFPPEDESSGYQPNDDFPEVPPFLLHPSTWRTVKMGKWKNRRQHITLKEGKALATCVRRLARASRNRQHRHLILVDSMALAFAITKGRAHSFGLLRVCQQVSALSIACGFSIRVRWIPSESNCADGPSRGQWQPGAYQKGFYASHLGCPQGQSAAAGTRTAEASCVASPEGGEQGDEEFSEETSQKSHEVMSEVSSKTSTSSKCGSPSGGSGGGDWEACTESSTHRPRGEEHFSGSSGSVSAVPVEVREFLQGRRLRVASTVKLRSCPGRLSGFDVPGQQVRQRGGEDSGSSRVSFRSVEGHVCSESPSFEGMEEGNASQEPLANAQYGHGGTCYGDAFKGQAAASPSNSGRLRRIPETWRISKLERKRCGIFDNSIVLDSPSRSFVGPLLVDRVREMNSKDDLLYPFSGKEFRKEFNQAALMIGLPGLHPYQMRHGGATEDLNMGIRDHAMVKARGRWFTDQSVRRYAKLGKVQQLLSQLSPSALEYCRWSQANLERVFKGVTPPRAP